MKRILALCSLLAMTSGALGDKWTDPVTGIEWTYTVSGGEASVGDSNNWAMAVPQSTTGIIVIPSTLGGAPVTRICKCAFSGWSGLTSMTIPEGVAQIDDGAFSYCSSLTRVAIPSSVTRIGEYMFEGCGALSSIAIAEGVTSIGASAFYYCSGLTSVTLPSSVTSIERHAFYNCSSMASVTLPLNITNIGDEAFSLCSSLTAVTMPTSVTSFGERVFYGCSRLKSLTLPSSVTRIGEWEFSGCSSLTSVAIPSNITSIGSYAFDWCSSLKSITIPPKVMSIGNYAFYSCIGLTSVTIPSSVLNIGNYAFSNCDSLKTIRVEDGDKDRVRDMLERSGLDTSKMRFVIIGESREYEIIAGAKVDIDVELIGQTSKNLPKGLSYNAKTGKVTGTVKTTGTLETTFSKDNVESVVTFIARSEVAPTVACGTLAAGKFTMGVAGAAGGMPIEIEAESGVKSVAQKNLPAGMKLEQNKTTKEWSITGAATKAGTFAVTLTVTTVAGTKVEKTFDITVAALPEAAVGTFNGFAAYDGKTFGTVQVTTTDAGKITAKVTTAAKAYSFAAACWDAVEDGEYTVTMTLKTGEELTLRLSSTAGWDAHQLTGVFAVGGTDYDVTAQRNAFGKTWYFDAEGDESEGWTLTYTTNAKTAALTLSLGADGKTTVAGKLGTLKVSASGFADVSGMKDGAIIADFAPVVTVNKVKQLLSIRTNLWFDRTNDHDVIGSAELVP